MQLKKWIICSAFPVVFLLSACNEHTVNREISHVIVLCDVSNSVTWDNKDSRIQKLKEYIRVLPAYYTIGSGLFYYPVSENEVSECIGAISTEIKYKHELPAMKKGIDSVLNYTCNKIDSIRVTNSCIISSVKRAVHKLKEINNSSGNVQIQNEIVIISDMLESCQKINMGDTARLSAAITALENKQTGLNAKDLNLKVTILLNTPYQGAELKSIEDAWTNWFSSIGVKKSEIHFGTGDLPDSMGQVKF